MSKRNEKPLSLPTNGEAVIDTKAKVNLREITRNKMEQEGWSQRELAFRLGTTSQVVNNWLHERQNLSYELVERLLQVLEIYP